VVNDERGGVRKASRVYVSWYHGICGEPLDTYKDSVGLKSTPLPMVQVP
jgi:hypothetical protein